MSPKRSSKSKRKRTKALDRAVRKVESREKRQDDRSGQAGKPVSSIGRWIRQGWVDGA